MSDVSLDKVARWCNARADGACDWDLSLFTLQDHVDFDNLAEDWEAIEDALAESIPVIVTVAEPNMWALTSFSHAVVVLGLTDGDGDRQVSYFDPFVGDLVELELQTFRQCWDACHSQAMAIRG